jgi:hypothetical protein
MPPTYEVEDDLDFFAALKTMQPAEPAHDDCLISSEPLNAFHVVLECGHKFNYEPLYQEVLRQKGRLGMNNYYEKIGTHQIKCPYCRTITNELLPYIGPHPLIKRLSGVNSPAHMCMPGVACSRCNANAFYEHESNLYCLRHYNCALKSKSSNAGTSCVNKCAAEIQTGKNKGKQCSLNAIQSGSVPHLCKKHSRCNVVLYGNFPMHVNEI